MNTALSKNLETRREHIVPRFLLTRFVGTDKLLWVFAHEREPRQSTPDSECFENDFYEYEVDGEKSSNKHERWLNGLETPASAIVVALAEHQQLYDKQAIHWARFVAALFLRTRKVRHQVSVRIAEEFGRKAQQDEYVRDLQYSLLQRGELHDFEDLKRQIATYLEECDANPAYYHTLGFSDRVDKIANTVLSKRWIVVDACPERKFVLSDAPVFTVGLHGQAITFGQGFDRPDTAVLLPISPERLFIASPRDIQWEAVTDAGGVDKLNRLIVQFAHRNVYASCYSPDIELHVNSDMNSFIYGQNVFVTPM